MPRQAEKAQWQKVHNRKPGEPRDTMSFYELLTPDQTAKVMGLTRQRVNQLERSALYKLRLGLRQYYEDFYE